jgi:hypothetical protein
VTQTYPARPSLAGSVLSRDLVEVLVRHSEDLKPFSTLRYICANICTKYVHTYVQTVLSIVKQLDAIVS